MTFGNTPICVKKREKKGRGGEERIIGWCELVNISELTNFAQIFCLKY